MRTHLHLILDTLAEDSYHRRLSPVVGRTLAALSLIVRDTGPLPGEAKLPSSTWAGVLKAIDALVTLAESHVPDAVADLVGDEAGVVKAIDDIAVKLVGSIKDPIAADDIRGTMEQCKSLAYERHQRDCDREDRSVSPAEVDADVDTINRVLQRVISNFAGVLVGDVFDNGCKSKPFFASGWVGWQLTTPAGDTRIHVGISLSESDETHDISGFVYQGDSPDLHSAEHALDHYIDVYRG